jgi:hypothetical protein
LTPRKAVNWIAGVVWKCLRKRPRDLVPQLVGAYTGDASRGTWRKGVRAVTPGKRTAPPLNEYNGLIRLRILDLGGWVNRVLKRPDIYDRPLTLPVSPGPKRP